MMLEATETLFTLQNVLLRKLIEIDKNCADVNLHYKMYYYEYIADFIA